MRSSIQIQKATYIFYLVKNAVIRVGNMQTREEKTNSAHIDTEAEESTKAIEKVISADMKLRGQYEPPSISVIRVRNIQAREEKINFADIDMETKEFIKAIEKIISANMKLRDQYGPSNTHLQLRFPEEFSAFLPNMFYYDDRD